MGGHTSLTANIEDMWIPDKTVVFKPSTLALKRLGNVACERGRTSLGHE